MWLGLRLGSGLGFVRVGVRIRRTGREGEKKRKKQNTRKGQNVCIQLKIDNHWFENFKLV